MEAIKKLRELTTNLRKRQTIDKTAVEKMQRMNRAAKTVKKTDAK